MDTRYFADNCDLLFMLIYRGHSVEFFKISAFCHSCVDKLLGKSENMEIISHFNFAESSPICEKIEALQSSLRRVLSPINSNINVENKSSRNQICAALLDPKTPKTPFLLSCLDDKSQKIGTPLDKLNALGSNLKVCSIFCPIFLFYFALLAALSPNPSNLNV